MEKPQFREIKLEDKPLFDSYFAKYQPEISEFTFTNLFAWRHSKKHEFCEFEGHLVISFSEEGKKRFYQPVGENPAEIITKLLGTYPESSFERVEKMVAEKLQGHPGLVVEEQRGMFDYVYGLTDMKELRGRKYEHKRNFLKQFGRNSPRICTLNDKTSHKYAKLQEKWYNMRRKGEGDDELKAENQAIMEVLNNYKALGVGGVCIFIGDEIEAFAIGERLNDTTYVEHFEKADSNYTGAYQYLLNEFSKSIPESFAYLNREQDLGIEGLRKAKLSYHPAKLVEKYKIRKSE